MLYSGKERLALKRLLKQYEPHPEIQDEVTASEKNEVVLRGARL